jgi:glycosyltransferase involved in cell wall biosynthesis
MTHNSLSSLQLSVDSLIRDGDLETPLEMIQAFVERIVLDPQAIGRVFSAPALDEICLRLGAQVLSQTNVATPAPSERRIVYVATEFYRHGGHTLVAADFVRYLPDREHVFLITDILSNPDRDAPDLRLVPLGAKVEVAPTGPRQEKLKWLLTRLFELAPEKIYWLNHHQDTVAIAAAQPAIPGEKYFIHHGDHQLCLGVHTPNLHHVDLANLGFFNCRDVLGIVNNHYWPLVCDDLGPRDPGRRFIEAGRLRTCSSGSANKFEIPYLYDYADVLVRVLRATGGDHVHVGPLSEGYIERIRRRLADEAISQEHFIYVPWVPSLWRALIERAVDVYLASWPIGGGKALIEAMGAGIPSIVHVNYISRFHSGFDLADADAPVWHTPKELVDRLPRLTPERLAAQSRSARTHYEKHHTPQVLASLLRGDTKDAPEPIPLREYCPDTLQVFLDERARFDERIATVNQALAEREIQVIGLNQAITELHGQVANLNQVVSERDAQISSLTQSVADLTEEVERRGEWALRLDSELKEAQSKLTGILRSNSWRIRLPLREARHWINAPKAEAKRYVKAALRGLKRTYQLLPLSPETKALHRKWISRYAPRVLLASGASSGSIPAVNASDPIPPGPLYGDDGASTRAKTLVSDMGPATSDSPIVSVILPVNGKIDATLRCLKAIEKQAPKIAFEVIVVDDRPADNSAELLSKASRIRLIANTENPGFVHSCNIGANAASGEYLLFLNNDTEVGPDWMDNIQRTFEDVPGKGKVKIAAVTMVYNEALILPYFLRHYGYLDEIHVLYETDSTDESLEILMQASNVVIRKGHIEGGLDDIEKINLINKTVQRIKADWVYVVDPDEFIFPPNNEPPHDFLGRQPCEVVRSGMYQVYRHREDSDLDPSRDPIPQRIHGDPDLFSNDEQANRPSNSVYIKPNIVRPSKRIRFLPGHHQIEGDLQTSPQLYVGAHWQMADPSIALARRMERKARISERNRAQRMGWQHFDVSLDKINEECERHLDDPVIDALCSFSELSVQNVPSGVRSDKLFQEPTASLNEQASTAIAVNGCVSRNGGDMCRFDPLAHPICLSSPRRTVPFLSWRQHVPFAMLLVDVLKPRSIVELGVHYGDSYCAFCQAVAELRLGTACYGVDTWKGDPHASFYGPEVLADLAAHHDPLYGSFSHLIQSTFDEALQHFSDGAIDILHIDGYHTYKAVKHDFEVWLPKVSLRGVILLHDINEKQLDFGVWRLWDEVKTKYPHFEFFHSHGLGIVAVGERPPEELSWLFEADEKRAAAIRNFFFCLGDRLTDKTTLSPKRESVAAGGSEPETLRAARGELEGVRSGALWRVAKKFQSLIDVLLPVGTRRRAYARRAMVRLTRPEV